MFNILRTISLIMVIGLGMLTFATPERSMAELKTVKQIVDDCTQAGNETSSFNIKCLTIQKGQGDSFLKKEEQAPIVNLILEIINIMAKVIAPIAVIAFIIGGYFLMTAAGDENQIERGKDIFLSAIIGLILVFMSYTIVRVVQAIFY